MMKRICVAFAVATAAMTMTNDASAGWFGGRWFGGQCNSGYVTTGTYYAAPAQPYSGNPAQADPGAYPDIYNQAFNTGTYAPPQIPRDPAAGSAYRSLSYTEPR